MRRRRQVVARQAGPARVVPDAAAEHEAADADAEARAGGQEERTARRGVEGVLVRRRSADHRHPGRRVERRAVERGEVDHEPLGGRQAGVVVAAAAGHERDPVLDRPLDGRHDVGLVGAVGDDRRADRRVAGVGGDGGRRVLGVGRRQHPPVHAGSEVGDRRARRRRGWRRRRRRCRRGRRPHVSTSSMTMMSSTTMTSTDDGRVVDAGLVVAGDASSSAHAARTAATAAAAPPCSRSRLLNPLPLRGSLPLVTVES